LSTADFYKTFPLCKQPINNGSACDVTGSEAELCSHLSDFASVLGNFKVG